MAAAPGAEAVVVGDLAHLDQTRAVADQVNQLGHFDAVIHNAAVGDREASRITTIDGLAHVFAINTLAAYVLTVLIRRPRRLVYLSSSSHYSGDRTLRDLNWDQRTWDGRQAYCDSKLHDTLLASAVARHWRDVQSNAVDPGWVPTRMGGPNAPDDLAAGPRTQVWLAVSADATAAVTGRYFHHQKRRTPDAAVNDQALQQQLLEACRHYSGIAFPD
jgi:NAD(P)-dependent dehydrogenase (short-subunit alcohol dehydrogenase family)